MRTQYKAMLQNIEMRVLIIQKVMLTRSQLVGRNVIYKIHQETRDQKFRM